MDEFRDLVPRKDVKGGSPKTPLPMPASQYQEYAGHTPNGTIWKVATSGLAGLFVGMTVAWFTALQSKGISQRDMQEYVDKSLAHDRELIAKDKSNQDRDNSDQERAIGGLLGREDRIYERLKSIEEKHIVYDNAIKELNDKNKYWADYLEEQRKAKR